jgi:hypothetical protein
MPDQFYQLLTVTPYRVDGIRDGIDYAATFSVEALGARTYQVYENVHGH